MARTLYDRMSDRIAYAFAAIIFLIWLGFVGTIGYVIFHFVTKYW